SRVAGEAVDVSIVEEEWQSADAGGEPQAIGADGGAPQSGGGPAAVGLNPKYTFEQFVIGSGNRLAHAAALAAAELPGQAYNPLFVHGPPGTGKTHLLHAIGNYVQLFGGGLSVRYATVETFTSEFVDAVRAREVKPFRDRFRGADVLLVDDVQLLDGKARTMEELFHTFNALYESGRQIVLTSDRDPAELGALEARLQERFRSGLVAELEPPELDVRLAILRKRARLDSVTDVGDDTLLEIARRASSSVRALEGALIRVVAYASLTGEQPTPEVARRVLARFGPQSSAEPASVDRIQEVTADVFGVSREALLAADRRPRVAFARQVAMYLARELTGESLPSIGREFGGRNHTTVLHACRRVERALRDQETTARDAVDNLRGRLGLSA
ncbi:MAG: chromosomal replication initiator protein DnaA, partial [Actinobacteria bacterium]|nr:chromosomal replication initiator protein DnaA [Actinomycetota bacterium]